MIDGELPEGPEVVSMEVKIRDLPEARLLIHELVRIYEAMGEETDDLVLSWRARLGEALKRFSVRVDE